MTPEQANQHRRFVLQRNNDVSGVSGTGIVAEGIEFTSGVVALTWLSDWPTSVVFHDRGIESVEAVHGHNGATRIVWLDASEVETALADDSRWGFIDPHGPIAAQVRESVAQAWDEGREAGIDDEVYSAEEQVTPNPYRATNPTPANPQRDTARETDREGK